MRRVEEVTISEEGRDKGKTFILTEMPAEQGELWAMQALYLIEKAGISIPEGQKENGMAGLASIGTPTELAFARALQDPSLDAVWSCVKYQPQDRKLPAQGLLPGDACQIEEIKTRMFLRVAVLKLHTAFFSPAKA